MLFFSCFNQYLNVLTILVKIPNMKFHTNPSRGEIEGTDGTSNQLFALQTLLKALDSN